MSGLGQSHGIPQPKRTSARFTGRPLVSGYRDPGEVWTMVALCAGLEVERIYHGVLVSGVPQSAVVLYIYSFSDYFPLQVITRY